VRYLLLLAACSGSKPRTADDASHLPRPADAALIDAIAIDAAPVANGKTGDLQVRVEWKDVPIPMRASPGRTSCKTPRAPAVAPTTTWGIPDVLVVVENAVIPHAPARIVLADCAFAPRLVAGSAVVLESAVDRPTKVTFAKRGTVAAIDKLDAGKPMAIQLPITGHAVTLPADDGGLYELAFESESAWVVASSAAGVTEPNGALLVKDLAPGKYSVTAWLPPRSGAPAKIAKGTAEVAAGDLAELVLELK
jgi:hypothetical protein